MQMRQQSFSKANNLTQPAKNGVGIGDPGLPNSKLHHLRELTKHSSWGTPAKNLWSYQSAKVSCFISDAQDVSPEFNLGSPFKIWRCEVQILWDKCSS